MAAAKHAKLNGAKCVHFELSFTLDGSAVISARPDVTSLTLEELRDIDASEGHVLVSNFVAGFNRTYSPALSFYSGYRV